MVGMSNLLLLRKTAKRLFAGTHDAQPDYLGEKVKMDLSGLSIKTHLI